MNSPSRYFETDLFRYFGRTRGGLREKYGERQQLGYLQLLRRAQHTSSRLLRALWRLRLAHASARTHIHIPWSCKIGPGFYIGHLGRVIINPAAVIGRNCNISTGVTIGMIPVGRRASAIGCGSGRTPSSSGGSRSATTSSSPREHS